VVVGRGLEDISFGYVHLTGSHREMGRLSAQWPAREISLVNLRRARFIAGKLLVKFLYQLHRHLNIQKMFSTHFQPHFLIF
jgi:hypothetical protein